MQQKLVPRQRFIACTLAGRADNMPSSTIRILGARAWKVDTSRIPERRGIVVQIVETMHSKSFTNRNPWSVKLVQVNGSWRWLLDWPTVDWYRSHASVCPK